MLLFLQGLEKTWCEKRMEENRGLIHPVLLLSLNLSFDSFIFFPGVSGNNHLFLLGETNNHLFLLGETRRDQCLTAVILMLWYCSIVTGSKPDFLFSPHFSTFQPQAHHRQPLLLLGTHLARLGALPSVFFSSVSVWCLSHCRLVGSALVHHHVPGPHGPGRGRGQEEWAPYTSRHTAETLLLGSVPPLDQVLCTFLCLGK